MATLTSRQSIASQHSQKILDDVITKSEKNRAFALQAPEMNDSTVNIVWDSLGKYVSRS